MPVFKYIAIEGPDGSGKTTLAKQITRKLEDHFKFDPSKEVIRLNPLEGTVGEAVKSILEKGIGNDYPDVAIKMLESAFLFTVKSIENDYRFRDEVEEVYVILDRWILSTLVYQKYILPPYYNSNKEIDLLNDFSKMELETFDNVFITNTVIILNVDEDTLDYRLQARKQLEFYEDHDSRLKVRKQYQRCVQYIKEYNEQYKPPMQPFYIYDMNTSENSIEINTEALTSFILSNIVLE